MDSDDRPAVIPAPAHPQRRTEPLPWQHPKTAEEDPSAPEHIRALLESSGYRRADQDVDFLALDETRGVRLQLDYLKTELLLSQQGIRHTIVVFGSTRITEPVTARAQVERLRAASAAKPRSKALQQRLKVAENILAKSRYYDIAREFGELVGRAGGGPGDRTVVVMTGGGPGIMEGANRGSHDVSAASVGLNINLPHEQYPNPYITEGLCFQFHYFALRKLHFLLRARALVAFPGGYGTLDELFETLTLIQTRKIRPLPVVLVGREFWERAFDVDFLVDEGVIDAEDRNLFWYAESAAEIFDGICHWHKTAGEPLFSD